jgi:hypothetical protein
MRVALECGNRNRALALEHRALNYAFGQPHDGEIFLALLAG